MPVRDKAIRVLNSERFKRHLHSDDLYRGLIESIDWNRVKLEANARCLTMHPSLPDSDLGCGDCLAAALLATETFPEYDT